MSVPRRCSQLSVRSATSFATVVACLMAVLVVAPVSAARAAPVQPVRCAEPAGASAPNTASPASAGLDKARLDDAIAFAASRMRTHVQVFRNNCLIGSGPLNSVTGNTPWNLFSSTKSVVSMLAGIAYTQNKLDLRSSIARYLPAGEVDKAHAAITVRDLLTQSSGLRQSIISEAATAGLDVDPDIAKETLALPVQHRPGTFFEYTQHGPDLLAYVVQRAVGQDLQQFAQQNLFGPLGIAQHDYYWARDRSDHTYGYAFLYMPPRDYSRLGLLMSNDGIWHGQRIIDSGYIKQLRTPSQTNRCYGYLFWVNSKPCTGPSFPSRQTSDVAPLAGLPSDAYAMVGFLQQNNFIVPSLGLMVSWNGFLGDVSPDPGTVLSASLNSELYHDFFRKLVAAFNTPRLPDPGPYRPTMNLNFDPVQFADPNVALGALGFGPYAPKGCTAMACGPEPLRLPLQGNPGCFAITCLPVTPDAPGRRGS
ncbi:serine hydrolase [Gordonia hankookensis]|uniref:Serine hydrolase n=2 Tax=Gordonia hankookensis TaxID=589403 RepID=A0ABR7WFZ7_9ACTN|nr:serine hydrolase [Gordonia hankookensis]